MALTKLNATAATLSKNRTAEEVSPFSGMCVTCIDGCLGMCEIGKSALRGAEMIYPQPYGIITAASQKNYPVDLSHFNIQGTAVGAVGIDADPDKAIFPNVNLEQKIGQDKKIKVKLPFIIPGLGSTNIARNNWAEIAIGSAISGTIITIGENICGMDELSEIKNGRIVKSPEMERRVRLFKDWQDGYGEIVVQENVEDSRLGVLEYVIEKLGVNIVELKWGQGAKDIGGEVKIDNLQKAQLLKKRGYVVLPDPLNPDVINAFKKGIFKEFERHSRVGMVSEESFAKRVKQLRDAGAKYIFLKTGAYRPSDLARAIKFSSKYKIDLVTVDGAGGGTGMSPWRMMNEWGIPAVELWTLTYQYADKLAKKGEYVPDIAIASGFTLEDQIFKGLALGAPYFKMIGMARAPLAAAMVGKNIGKRLQEGNIPVYIERYGTTIEEIFVCAEELKSKYGKNFKDIPTGAIALYTYYQRLAQGLRQLMCGARKFALQYITRDDIVALTEEASRLTGIAYTMDADKEEVEKILNS